MKTRSGTRLVSTLATLVVLGACTANSSSTPTPTVSGSPRSTAAATSTNPSSGTPSTSSTGGSAPTITSQMVAAYQLGASEALDVDLFGHRLVVSVGDSIETAGPGHRSLPDRVLVIDRRTGKLREVARTRWRNGFINWVGGEGKWVAWVDQSHQQNDSQMSARWQINAEDLSTGHRVVLRSSGSTASPYIPEIMSGPDGFYWHSTDPARPPAEYAWHPGDRTPGILFRDPYMVGGSETFDHGYLTYLGHSAAHGRSLRGDCWTVPLAGGKPTPLTRTGLAMSCASEGGSLVWSEHIDPAHRPRPSDGILDDPWSFWTRARTGGTPRLLHQGYTQTRYPVLGPGFSTWYGAKVAFVVHALRSHGLGQVAAGEQVNPAVGSDIQGSLLAWSPTPVPGKSVIINVTRIQLPR